MIIEVIIGVALGVAVNLCIWRVKRSNAVDARVRRMIAQFSEDCANAGYDMTIRKGGRLVMVFDRNSGIVARVGSKNTLLDAFLETLESPTLKPDEPKIAPRDET